MLYQGRSARARAAILTVAYLLFCSVVAGLHSISMRIGELTDALDAFRAEVAAQAAEESDETLDDATSSDARIHYRTVVGHPRDSQPVRRIRALIAEGRMAQ